MEESNMAERLRKLREDANLSRRRAALRIHIKQSTLSAYENGRRKPSNNVMAQMVIVYNTTLDYIVFGHSKKKIIDVSGIDYEIIGDLSKLTDDIRVLSSKEKGKADAND